MKKIIAAVISGLFALTATPAISADKKDEKKVEKKKAEKKDAKKDDKKKK